MLRSLVRFSICNRKLFPSTNSVSSTLSPSTILTGLPFPDESYFSLEFGAYVHTHDSPEITNQLNPPRSTGAIVLGPTTQNSGCHFIPLTTGARILRYKWTVLPLSKVVITRVHTLSFPLQPSSSPPPTSLHFTCTDGSPLTPIHVTPEGVLGHDIHIVDDDSPVIIMSPLV